MFRSLLFVPAHRPERYAKAIQAGADSVCIDLEDAVPAPERPQARKSLAEYLASREKRGPAVGVRMNCVRSTDGFRDVNSLLDGPLPDFIMVPKVDHPNELTVINDVFGGRVALWPIMESAQGARRVWEIAEAPGVVGIIFGAADYSADVRCRMEWEPLMFARGSLAAACAGAGIELLDVPHIEVRDTDGLIASTHRVKAMGFTGRACIHPDQVGPVNTIFAPSREEIEQARRIMDAFTLSKGAATLLDGKLVERPQIRAAERILSIAS